MARRWSEQRAWFGAIGNTGKPDGNPCPTLITGSGGRLFRTVSVPRPVAQRRGVGAVGRPEIRHGQLTVRTDPELCMASGQRVVAAEVAGGGLVAPHRQRVVHNELVTA